MTQNFSFIRLYKNDFTSAKLADDTPIQTLKYGGFIVQKPNETFLQISGGSESISFVGGIQVDLIDCNGLIVKNIDSNFFYEGFVDSSGVNQIAFEFGLIGVDYWTKQLYLKITDDVNGNIWYSNGFLVTDYKTNLSTRFDYFNQTKIYNISYDLAPYIQSVRVADCYDQTPVNKRDLKQYVNANGLQTNYRAITTFLRKYLINSIDYFINDRFEVLFSHQQVYVNGERAVISDFKIDERKGDTNWFNGEFTVNKQNQQLVENYQLFEYLEVISKTPLHLGTYTVDSLPSIQLTFNKDITLSADFKIKLYKGGVLQTIAPATYTPTGNVLDITPSYTFTNGEYSIVIEPNLVYNGVELWSGFGANEWTFTVASGEFEATEFSNEFLTN